MTPRFAATPRHTAKLPIPRARRLRNAGRLACAFLILVATFVAVPNPVYAYIDPGTGSLIIQAVLAGVLTVGATVKIFWHQIKEKYRKLFHKDEPEK